MLGGGGGGVDGEGGGGVFGIVDGVGQVALASITDPSGQVLVVGDVGGGVNVCVQDGSFGFFVQSTGGGVPEVQLFTHVDPVPGFPDDGIDVFAGIDVLLGCDGADDVVMLTYGHEKLFLHGTGGFIGHEKLSLHGIGGFIGVGLY